MNVLILGGDGYLGWPTAMRFSKRGDKVTIVDNMVKRLWEAELGVSPLYPLPSLRERVKVWEQITGLKINIKIGDIAKNPRFLYKIIENVRPDCVIHYAEQPSAPFSMIDRDTCVTTHINNIVGTLNLMFAVKKYVPTCHILKLGTMGEYGTPNIDIEEGWLEVIHNGRSDRVLYPKKPGSFYHLTKVHDSNALCFGARAWDLRVTDLNQGVVYGVNTPETLLDESLRTSFHYDSVFGTVINRFITQASINSDLTVYGDGSQRRGFLNILDTLKCVELASENPPSRGDFRVFNQFTEMFSISELAVKVSRVARARGYRCNVHNVVNPRVEQTQHYYNAKNDGLIRLGLKPTLFTDEVVAELLDEVQGANVDRENAVDTGPLWNESGAGGGA